MKQTLTTLGLKAGSDRTLESLLSCIREKADLSRKVSGDGFPQNANQLENLANATEGCDVADQRIRGFYIWSQELGHDGRYVPGERASEFLARHGAGQATPQPDAALNELLTVSIEDGIADIHRKYAGIEAERDQAQLEAKKAQDKAEKVPALEDELREAREEKENLSGYLTEARDQLEFLQQQQGGNGSSAPKPKKPRRTSMFKETNDESLKGIYYLLQGEEVVYEVGWTDAAGKQQWKVIGTDLDEAQAKRKELVAEASREAVAA